jgi:hypothetical protein
MKFRNTKDEETTLKVSTERKIPPTKEYQLSLLKSNSEI